MTYWQQFLDSLDTSGGHIVVALALLGIGIAIGSMEVEMLAVGVLARGLGSAARQNEASDGGEQRIRTSDPDGQRA